MSLEAVVAPSISRVSQVRDNSKDSPARVGRAAMDFEALLLGQMLKSAREAGEGR